jgi:RNA polymerase sigma-70 factor (ECF subfamily)
MSASASFADLVRRIRARDEAAATELVRRYEPAIRRSVRLRLDPRLRRTCDSMDICQAVLGSFFARAASDQYDLETPEHLLKLLATMARHKLSKTRRHQQQARRDHRRETGRALEHELKAPGPSPSQHLGAKELLAEIRLRLSAKEQQMMELRHQGRDWAAIAAELGGSPEALRKKLARAIARVTVVSDE